LDYSNIVIEKLKYEPTSLQGNVRDLTVIFETNEPVDSGLLECTLSDYSGSFLITGGDSGLKTEHVIIFNNIPKSVQLAELSVVLEGQSLIKNTLIMHPIMSEYINKDNMSTISPEFIINRLLSNEFASNNVYDNE
jgi:hypothetical protein